MKKPVLNGKVEDLKDLKEFLRRHPWISRSGLIALFNFVRGTTIVAGFSEGTGEAIVAAVLAVVTLVADYVVIRNGEEKTTSLHDPRDGFGRRMRVYPPYVDDE